MQDLTLYLARYMYSTSLSVRLSWYFLVSLFSISSMVLRPAVILFQFSVKPITVKAVISVHYEYSPSFFDIFSTIDCLFCLVFNCFILIFVKYLTLQSYVVVNRVAKTWNITIQMFIFTQRWFKALIIFNHRSICHWF